MTVTPDNKVTSNKAANNALSFYNNLSVRSKLLLAFSVPLLLMLIVAVTVYFNVSRTIETSNWVEYTHEVIGDSRELAKLILDMETSERGFLITGKEQFLQPFNKAQRQWDSQIESLKRTVSDNSNQVRQLKDIDQLEKKWLTVTAAREIAQRRTVTMEPKNLNDIQNMVKQSQDKTLMNDLYSALIQLETEFDHSNNIAGANLTLVLRHNLLTRTVAMRSYLLTGDKLYLTQFDNAHMAFDQSINRLRSFAEKNDDDKDLSNQLSKLTALLQQWFEQVADPILNNTAQGDESILPIQIASNPVTDNIKRAMSRLDDALTHAQAINARKPLARIAASLVELESWMLNHLTRSQSSPASSLDDIKKRQMAQLVILRSSIDNHSARHKLMPILDNIQNLSDLWLNQAAKPALSARAQLDDQNKAGQNVVNLYTMQQQLNLPQNQHLFAQSSQLINSILGQFEQSGHHEGTRLAMQIANGMQQQNAGLRGYLISGDPAFLSSYNLGQTAVRQILPNLQNLVEDNYSKAALTQQLSQLAQFHKQWRNQVVKPVLNAQNNHRTALPSNWNHLFLTGERLVLLDKIHRTLMQARDIDAELVMVDIEKSLLHQQTALQNYISSGQTAFLHGFEQAKAQFDGQFTKLSDIAQAALNKDKLSGQIDELRNILTAKEKVAAEHIELRKKVNRSGGSMSDVTALLESEVGKNIINQIKLKIDEFIATEQSLMRMRTERAEQASANTLISVVVLTMSSIVIAMTVAAWVSGAIVQKLKEMLEMTTKVGQGDFDVAIESPVNDEIGHLGEALNTMTKELDQSNQEMIKANEAKNQFLANMSHEIRTPMNGVLGMLTLLEHTKLDEEQKELLATLRTCGDGLMVVLNDILDFSKIQSDKMLLEVHPFNLQKFLDDTLYLLNVRAKQKDIGLYYEIALDTPKGFSGDINRLRQVLMNLISNAVKFTEHGEVVVTVSAKSVNNTDYRLRIAVKDTGIGISKEKQQSLFKPFSQADLSTTRQFGGTGLGLAICQKLIQLMEGEIWIESELGKGSTFIFEVPLSEAHVEISNTQVNDEPLDLNETSPLPKLKILVVEDNIINQQLAIRMLKHLGLEADVVGDGKQALIAIDKKAYDVVFMDVQMPIMDGLEATREIIRIHGDNRPKIIAMTANVFEEDKKRCFDAGMDDFVGKPLEGSILVQALRMCHQRKAKNDNNDSLFNVQQQIQAFDETVLDVLLINRRFKGMFDIYVKMARLFIKQSPTTMSAIFDAIDHTDSPGLKAAAHELKGVLGNLCAKSLAERASQLEQLAKEAQFNKAQIQAKELAQYIDPLVQELEDLLNKQENLNIK